MEKVNILRKELDKLVIKWEEKERENNLIQQDKWRENNFKGFPKDYIKNLSNQELRKGEKEDIENLRENIPCNIIFKECGGKRMNCHCYAISNIPELFSLVNDDNDLAFKYGGYFLYWLKTKRLLKESKKPHEGNIILYYDNYELKHSGILNKDKGVVSKWGGGNVYEHGLMEVPSSYGDPIIFELIKNEKDLEDFKKCFFEELIQK